MDFALGMFGALCVALSIYAKFAYWRQQQGAGGKPTRVSKLHAAGAEEEPPVVAVG